ncbi:MAG: hypothetical protein H0T20_03865 [Actinobacteria bacterium]|nr:hypothetical protein [Actinomycetota bacterium]
MTEVADKRQPDEGVRERATGAVEDATSAAQDKAMELRSKGASQLREQLDTRTTDVGRQARSVAQALRQSGQNLRGEGNAQAASVTDNAAQRAEQLGEYLERVEGDQLLRDAERFARQRPWLLAGVGLFAGLIASRMMKASSEQRYQASSSDGAYTRSSTHEPGAQAGAGRSA